MQCTGSVYRDACIVSFCLICVCWETCRPSFHKQKTILTMPNPWTGVGNPYTTQEARERLQQTLADKKATIAAVAGTGTSAIFIERGGADLIIIYNRSEEHTYELQPPMRT